MNDNKRKQSVKAYFDGIAAKDMSRVPWAKDATLRTPLNPAGGESVLIRGRKAILDFFTSILPAVRSLELLHYYTGNPAAIASVSMQAFNAALCGQAAVAKIHDPVACANQRSFATSTVVWS